MNQSKAKMFNVTNFSVGVINQEEGDNETWKMGQGTSLPAGETGDESGKVKN
jgi:hypothetical protein